MESTSKIPVSIYAEMTPNPAVLKFVANKRLIEADSYEFRNIEEAKFSPLATKLFHYPFVKEVFVSGNYLAITKYDIVEWDDVTLEIREMIRDFIASGEVVVNEGLLSPDHDAETPIVPTASHPDEKSPGDYLEIEKKIAGLLDEYVKPAVEQDGGNIKFLQYDEGTVKVLLQGACSGCPSSTMTLKQGIQNLLNQMLPGQIDQVVAVNG
ncbi:MAG TPA: NifU family protein [Cryomorphaceae bacterium]|nr:NifU family protein [Owenweeksia sp.]MBF98331.1 NifU family protein [Owenweeksia sp.]HAD97406.1 NifU family protein [Cryomorphaceae bacterium]HBF20270.1 NifU family protein [Cryomorphaceae bacterium]HCQ16564.1 NifU family protein [Cryomorphaceae bacterium]|tara:strand:+ start:602 stop:1231 length:630 start_codon:yes stop_codon:yes gene_type:complete